MFQTAVLYSGSKGNSVLVKSEEAKILVDVGVSGKKLEEAMKKLSLSPQNLTAVVVSHEHSDHILGVGVICRKYSLPLYITKKTYSVSEVKLKKISSPIMNFSVGDSFLIGDILVSSFTSSHDAIDSCSFTFEKSNKEGGKLAIAMDVGYSHRLLTEKLRGASTIILELNYDKNMLFEGSYPWELKQRINCKKGHLSNEDAAGIISRVLHPNLKNIILAHLSEENNTESLAKENIEKVLREFRFSANLMIASQYSPTKLIDI